MAYADKSTDMRRCCISIGGHVEWEGVEFYKEEFLMRRRTGWGDFDSVLRLNREELDRVIEEYNTDSSRDEYDKKMLLLFQDDEDCDWHVKEQYVNSMGDEQQ
jgi:hypothetical protein